VGDDAVHAYGVHVQYFYRSDVHQFLLHGNVQQSFESYYTDEESDLYKKLLLYDRYLSN
jgi:hypothetical protein